VRSGRVSNPSIRSPATRRLAVPRVMLLDATSGVIGRGCVGQRRCKVIPGLPLVAMSGRPGHVERLMKDSDESVRSRRGHAGANSEANGPVGGDRTASATRRSDCLRSRCGGMASMAITRGMMADSRYAPRALPLGSRIVAMAAPARCRAGTICWCSACPAPKTSPGCENACAITTFQRPFRGIRGGSTVDTRLRILTDGGVSSCWTKGQRRCLSVTYDDAGASSC